MRTISTCLLLALLGACRGRQPIDRIPAEARVRASLGPGGGVVRGAGGTALEGVVLDVPLGALPHLVELEMTQGDDLAVPGTVAGAAGLRVRLVPDPGPLLVPATLHLPVALPGVRAATDLVLVGRKRSATPVGVEVPPRIGLVGTDPALGAAGIASFLIQELDDVQVRLTDVPRRQGGGDALAQRALEALGTGTDAGLLTADQLLAEAQRTDPFAPIPPALRAFTRVAVVLNDRTDDTPGLDSVGEALERLGLPVSRRSLWVRLVAGERVWPFTIAEGAPLASEIVAMLRARVRPALELVLDDLAQVPAVTAILFRLSLLEPWLPGERELDLTDLLAWRALVLGGMTAIDSLEDLDLDFNLATWGSTSIADILARSTGLLRRRAGVEARTAAATTGAAQAAFHAWRALRAEPDDQADDLFVMPEGYDAGRQATTEANLAALLAGVQAPGVHRLALQGFGDLLVQPWLLLGVDAGLALRDLLPRFEGDHPLALTLADPQLFGLAPGLTQERAAELADLVYLQDLPTVAVVVDGDLREWPGEALALADPLGDVETRDLVGVDLATLRLARTGGTLAAAFTVHDGAIAPRPGQSVTYSLELRGDLRQGGPRPVLGVEVILARDAVRLIGRVDGVETALPGRVALSGSVLELIANVAALGDFAVGAGVHLVSARVVGENLASAREVVDTSNRVLLVR